MHIHFECFTTRSRERLLMHKMERIYDDSSQISYIIDRHQQALFDGVAGRREGVRIHEEKATLDGLMDSMNDLIRTKSNKGVSLEEIPQIEEAINEVQVKTENL